MFKTKRDRARAAFDVVSRANIEEKDAFSPYVGCVIVEARGDRAERHFNSLRHTVINAENGVDRVVNAMLDEWNDEISGPNPQVFLWTIEDGLRRFKVAS